MALAIIMLPLIARSSQEVLLLVPGTLREAADALGVEPLARRSSTVVLPAAAGGIVTGADPRRRPRGGRDRAAALRRLDRQPDTDAADSLRPGVPNIPVLIFTASDLGDPEAQARAWGAAFVLLG